MTNDDETLKELKKISKILAMAHGEQLEKELSKIASTDDRKRIWVLMNGELTPEEISRQTNITIGTIKNYLTILKKAELIENPYGKPPKKLIEYIPPRWVELLKLPEEKTEEKTRAHTGGDV
jgi:hypothetical protein